MTVSDAFLVYVEIYGYDVAKGQTEREMFAALQKCGSEIQLADRGRQVELVQDPEKAKELLRPSVLNWFIPAGLLEPDTLKAAFIYTKTAETSSWTYAHELGRMHIEQVLGEKVKTLAFDQANTEEEVSEDIEEAIRQGCSVIFTTAVQMVNQSVRSAILHPDVKIYNCSIKMSYSSICTYYARMYESKFLLGAIAAAMARDDKLGYIADYPIYGTMANINAFAMGARMVNPYVKVYLDWSRSKEGDAAARLESQGIRYISGDDMITPKRASRRYGLYRVKPDGSVENLATPIWHWGKFYEQIIRIILGSSGDTNAAKGKKAVNYWWGMSADVIDVIGSENMPHGINRLAELLRSSIRSGSFHPFDGLIYSQKGIVQCEKGGSLKPDDIITMEWLAENVVGKVPEFEELTDEAKRLVQLQDIEIDETAATEKLTMNILVLADHESKILYDYYDPKRMKGIDLIISCGDLEPEYLSFFATMCPVPVLYVRGNHDGKYKNRPPEGCICIEDDIFVFRGVRIMGLGGSMEYIPDSENQYTERQMRARVRKMFWKLWRRKGFDILVTHAPAYHVNDMEDLPHRAFGSFVPSWKNISPGISFTDTSTLTTAAALSAKIPTAIQPLSMPMIFM